MGYLPPYHSATNPSKIVLSQFSGMIGDYAAAWMPSVFIPLLALGFFVSMAVLFNVVEANE